MQHFIWLLSVSIDYKLSWLHEKNVKFLKTPEHGHELI